MTFRPTSKPITRAARDFFTGLGIFTLVLAAVTADAATAWSLQPAATVAAPAKTTLPAATPAATAGFAGSSTQIAIAPLQGGATTIDPYLQPDLALALSPSSRQIAMLVLAMMFSLISVVILRSTRHLRRVIASPRRGEWGRS